MQREAPGGVWSERDLSSQNMGMRKGTTEQNYAEISTTIWTAIGIHALKKGQDSGDQREQSHVGLEQLSAKLAASPGRSGP